MSVRSFVSRQPVALACLAALVVSVSGGVAITRIVSEPTATKTRTLYVPTPTPVPGPTQTVFQTKTKRVVAKPSPAPTVTRTVSKPVQLRCATPQLSLTLKSSKSHYAQGETITLTATLHRADPPDGEYQHFDPRLCFVDPGAFTVYLTDDEQQPVYPATRCCLGVYPIYTPYDGAQFAMARGASHTISYTWDGKVRYAGSTDPTAAYAGNYHAVAQWMYPYADSSQITFHLAGPTAP